MGVLGYKIISLSKQKEVIGGGAVQYEADLNDDKFKEIATALGCNLKILTEGSRWLLYKGTDDQNGWVCFVNNNYFTVTRYIKGQVSSDTTSSNRQCYIQLSNSSAVKLLRLTYSKGKNGVVLFKFGNDDGSNILYYCIAEASMVDSGDKIAVYGYIDNGSYRLNLSGGELINYGLGSINNYGYSDNFILMSAIPLKYKNAIVDGLYICEINKEQTDHYLFDLNGKKYMASDNSAAYKWAIELDDSMLD